MEINKVFSELSSTSILVIGRSFWIFLLTGVAFLFFFLNKIEDSSINSFSVIFLLIFTLITLASFLFAEEGFIEKPEIILAVVFLYFPFLGWFVYEALFEIIIQNNTYLVALFLALISTIVLSVVMFYLFGFLVIEAASFSNEKTMLIFKSWGTTLITVIVLLGTVWVFIAL